MLIDVLCDYYTMLEQSDKVAPEGYEFERIDHIINLTEDGDIKDIINCCHDRIEKDNKDNTRTVYDPKVLPIHVKLCKSSSANALDIRAKKIFGLEWNKESNSFKLAISTHKDMVEKSLDFIDGLDSPLINAYRKFLEKWNPETEIHNPILDKIKNVTRCEFCINGDMENLLHFEPQVKSKWMQMVSSLSNTIPEVHPISIRLNGCKGEGGALCSVNDTAGESYGQSSSVGSNISWSDACKYAKALNYLLASPNHCIKDKRSDITYVCFAVADNSSYIDMDILDWLDAEESMDITNTADVENWVSGVMKNFINGYNVDKAEEKIQHIDTSVKFYIFGLKPSGNRIYITMMYCKTFGELYKNVKQHYIDMQSSKAYKEGNWSINNIFKEVLNEAAYKTVPSTLTSMVYSSIVFGTNYPSFLMDKVIHRISIDKDINKVRIGIIKGCLNRRNRFMNKEEEFNMMLDTENKNAAYLCGRLFSKLESMERVAKGNYSDITSTRDRYFDKAMSYPGMTFSEIYKWVYRCYAKKLNTGTYVAMNKEISSLMDMIGEFPRHLSAMDQGVFLLGYDHQNIYDIEQAKERKLNNQIADEASTEK